MLDFQEIEKIFCNKGGIHFLKITTIDNFLLDGTVNNDQQIFDVEFRTFTGKYNETSSISQAGSSSSQVLTFFIPRKRFAIEHLIKQTYNRKIAIQGIDRNGDVHTILSARMTYEYSSGENKPDSNGYSFRFEGKTIKKPFFAALSFILFGDNGFTPGNDTNPEIEDPDGGNPTSDDICCITINPAQLDYVPGETDNANNNNEIVTGSDDNIYFIDKDGRGVLLRTTPYRQRITGTGTSFSIDNQLADLAPEQILVERNGVVLESAGSPSGVYHYNITGNSLSLSSDWPLAADEYLNLYKL